jgi:hypothetical protein
MLIEKYLMKAHGEGDLELSPVFQGTMDWLFEVICAGHDFDPYILAGKNEEHTRFVMTPSFDISRYETLHDFLTTESVLVSYSQSHREEIDEEPYCICEVLPDAIKQATVAWLKRENALNGVDQGSVYNFATFVCTGVLGSMFGLPMHDGLFEKEMVKRCTTPEQQVVFGLFYGYQKAAKLFPKSKARGKWLEEALGL